MAFILNVGYLTCFFIAYFIFQKLKHAFELFVLARMKSNQIDFVDRYGPWAVVTGSTDGIGKAYARELAKRGVKIVLISRNPEKLNTVAHEIKSDFNVETKTITADFSKGPSIYENIKRGLEGIEIGILVNNVCAAVDHPQYFEETSFEFIDDVLNVNLGALLRMTNIVLPQMRKRNKGAIVNVSSITEITPLPYFSTYGATKAFIKSLTYALQIELRKSNITVQLLSPGFVKTKFVEFSSLVQQQHSMTVPNVETFASHAVSTLGHSKHTTGYWNHGFQYFVNEYAPTDLQLWVSKSLTGLMRREYNKNLAASVKAKLT